MELDYKKIHDLTMRELVKKTEQALLFEGLATQLTEEKQLLEQELEEKNKEIERLKRELENRELLDTDNQE